MPANGEFSVKRLSPKERAIIDAEIKALKAHLKKTERLINSILKGKK